MSNWEDEKQKVRHRSLGIEISEGDEIGQAPAEMFDVYFLLGKENNYSRICFVNSEGIRFDFHNKTKRLENEDNNSYMNRLMEEHCPKILAAEDLNFDKPLDEYVHFFRTDGNRYVSGLTKLGAQLVNVINDNPDLINRVKDDELRRILTEESVVLLSRDEALNNRIYKYQQKNFFCEYGHNAAGVLDGFTVTYKNNLHNEVKREYKLSVYHLNKAFIEVKRLLKTPEKIIEGLKDKEENAYKKSVIEAFIHYNWDWNVSSNKNFDKTNYKNFKIYKVPTLYEMIQFYTEKRIVNHYNGVLASEFKKLPKDEYQRRINELIYSQNKLADNVSMGAIDFIEKITGVPMFPKIDVRKEVDAPDVHSEFEDGAEDDFGVLDGTDEPKFDEDKSSDKKVDYTFQLRKVKENEKPFEVPEEKRTNDFLYKTLTHIENGLNDTLRTIHSYKKAISQGDKFDYYKVFGVIKDSVKNIFKPSIKEIENVVEEAKTEDTDEITLKSLSDEVKELKGFAKKQDEEIKSLRGELQDVANALFKYVPTENHEAALSDLKEVLTSAELGRQSNEPDRQDISDDDER